MLINTTAETEMATIYEHTTVILGMASLIMGITLYTLHNTLNSNRIQSKSGLKFLAIAMFALSIINLLEYAIGLDSQKEHHSLSIVVFAASIELFLIFMAYMSMLNKEFAVRRRIGFEIGYIALFTTPGLFVSPDHHPLLFNILFSISVTFYWGCRLFRGIWIPMYYCCSKEPTLPTPLPMVASIGSTAVGGITIA